MRRSEVFSQKVQTIDRRYLYLILFVFTSVAVLFRGVILPTSTTEHTIAFYREMMQIPSASTILLESDWTYSTRGENQGQLEALLRIIQSRKIKFALYSLTDAQAPEVAEEVITSLNQEFIRRGQLPLSKWEDWVNLGYFPDPTSFLASLVLNLPKTLKSIQNTSPNGNLRSVLESPVLSHIHQVENFKILICITGSNIIRTLIRLLGSPPKVTLAVMVTGVWGPEILNFYTAKLIKSVVIGLHGTVEIETMMANGINVPNKEGKIIVRSIVPGEIPELKHTTTYARGMSYYLALQVMFVLIIFAIILGNIGYFMSKRKPHD